MTHIFMLTSLLQGMAHIHANKLIASHGYLKSSNCLITSHFGLKISDFGTVNRYFIRADFINKR